MLKMKKLFAGFVMFSLIFCTSACTNPMNLLENVKDNVASLVSENEEINIEYSDEEIYNAFLEAYDFYYLWIYGQYYIDRNTSIIKDGVFTAETTHDEIKTSEQLIGKIHSYFPEIRASKYIVQLQPYDENGKLYINHNGGVGDNGIEFNTYSIEKVDNKTYILTLFLKNTFVDQDIKSQVLCTLKDNKLLFDNYTDSPFAEDDDYVVMF